MTEESAQAFADAISRRVRSTSSKPVQSRLSQLGLSRNGRSGSRPSTSNTHNRLNQSVEGKRAHHQRDERDRSHLRETRQTSPDKSLLDGPHSMVASAMHSAVPSPRHRVDDRLLSPAHPRTPPKRMSLASGGGDASVGHQHLASNHHQLPQPHQQHRHHHHGHHPPVDTAPSPGMTPVARPNTGKPGQTLIERRAANVLPTRHTNTDVRGQHDYDGTTDAAARDSDQRLRSAAPPPLDLSRQASLLSLHLPRNQTAAGPQRFPVNSALSTALPADPITPTIALTPIGGLGAITNKQQGAVSGRSPATTPRHAGRSATDDGVVDDEKNRVPDLVPESTPHRNVPHRRVPQPPAKTPQKVRPAKLRVGQTASSKQAHRLLSATTKHHPRPPLDHSSPKQLRDAETNDGADGGEPQRHPSSTLLTPTTGHTAPSVASLSATSLATPTMPSPRTMGGPGGASPSSRPVVPAVAAASPLGSGPNALPASPASHTSTTQGRGGGAGLGSPTLARASPRHHAKEQSGVYEGGAASAGAAGQKSPGSPAPGSPASTMRSPRAALGGDKSSFPGPHTPRNPHKTQSDLNQTMLSKKGSDRLGASKNAAISVAAATAVPPPKQLSAQELQLFKRTPSLYPCPARTYLQLHQCLLQNNTLCGFGGLEAYPSLVFQWVQQRLACRPGCRAVYSEACRRLRVPTSNAVLEQLPYTPGRYFNTRKAVEASGSVFGDTQFIALLPVLRVCRATEVLVGRGCLISDVSIYALAESLVVPGTDPFNEELHARLAEIPSLIEQAKKVAEEEERIQRRQLPHQQALMRDGGRRNSLVQNSSLTLKADSSVVLARSTSPTGGAAGTAFAPTGAFDDNADSNVHTSRSEHQLSSGAEPPAQENNERNALLRRMSASDGDGGTGEADDEAGVSKSSMSGKPTPTARGRPSPAPTPPLVGDSSTLFSAEKTKFDKAQARAFSTFASPEWKSRGSKFCGPGGSGPTTGGEGEHRSAPATGRPPRHDQQRLDHSKQQSTVTPQTARGPQTDQHQVDQSSKSRHQTPPGPLTRPSHSRERSRSAHASPSPNRDRSTAESNSRPASRAPARRGGERSPSRIGPSSSPRRPTSQSKSRSRRHSTPDDSSSVNGGDLQRVLEIPVSSARLFDFSATCSSVDDDEDIDESDPRNKHRRWSRRDSTAFSANEGRQQHRRSSAHPHGSGQSPLFGQNQNTQGGAVGGKHRSSLLFDSSATSAAQESLASQPPGFDGALPRHGGAKRGSGVSSGVLESHTGDDATSASAWRSEPQSAQDRPILFRVRLIDEEGEHVNANGGETPRSFGVPHPPGHGGPGTSPGGAHISGTHGAQHQSALMLDEPTAVEGGSSREMQGRDPDSPSCSLAGEPHRNGNGTLHPHGDDDGNTATLRPSDQESSPNAGGEFSIPAVAGHARRSQVNIALTPTFIAGGGGGAARGGAEPSRSPGRRSLVSSSPTRMRSPSTAGGAGGGVSRRASTIHGAGGADSPFSDSPPCKGLPSEPKQLLDPAQLFLQSIHNAERALTAPKRGSMSPPPRRASQAPSPAPTAPSYNRAGSPARKSIVGRAGPRASCVSQTSDSGFGGGGGGNGNGGLMFGGHSDLPIPSASATQIAAAAVYSPSMSPTRSILQQLARGSLFSHAGDDPDDPIQEDGRQHDTVRPAGALPGGSPASHVVSSTGPQAQQQQQQQQRQRESIVSGIESSKQKHRTPASTRRLTSLELSSNPNITDLSIPALIQLAIAIPTLTRICVQKTGISPRGAALLRDVLESNSRRSKRASRGRHGARRSQFFSSAFHEGSKDRGLFSSSKSIHSGRDGTVSDRVSTAKRQQTVNTLSAEDFHHAVRAFSALMTPGTGVVDLQTLSQIQPHVAASVRRKLAAQAGDDLKKTGKSKPGTTIGSASVMASMFTHQQTDEDENEHNRFSKPFSANDANDGSDGNSKGANGPEGGGGGGNGGVKRTRRPGRAPARASGPDATAVNFVVYCEATHPTLPHDVLLRELTQHSEYILAQPMAPPVMDRLTTEQRLDALDVFGELCAVSDDRIVAAAKAKSEREKAEKAKQKAVLARLGIEDDEDSSLYASGSDPSSSLSSSDGEHHRDDSESRHVRKRRKPARRSRKSGHESTDEEEDPRKAIKGRIWDETETPRSRPIATFLSAAALRAQLPSEAGKEALDFVLRRNAGIARRGGWTTDEFVAMASTMYVEQRLRKRLQSADK